MDYKATVEENRDIYNKRGHVKTNFSLVGILLKDPAVHEYTIKSGRDTGQIGWVCNLLIEEFSNTKQLKEVFDFVTFDKNVSAFIGANYKIGDKIVIVDGRPCRKQVQKKELGRIISSWTFSKIEAQVTPKNDTFVREPDLEDEIDGDIPF